MLGRNSAMKQIFLFAFLKEKLVHRGVSGQGKDKMAAQLAGLKSVQDPRVPAS